MTNDPSEIARVPPHDDDAEQALLGSLLLEADADGLMLAAVSAILRPEDFYATKHRRLFEVVLALHARGAPADPLVVLRECEKEGLLEGVGGKEYLAGLASAVPSAANAEHYARIVRDRAIARSALGVAEEVRRAIIDGAAADDVVGRLEEGALALSERHEPARVYAGIDLARDLSEDWETPPEGAPGVPTGLVDLDAVTGGLRPGNLAIVAGRPSMGKTTFALNVARHAAVEHGVPLLFVSLEVSRREVERNLAASISGVETTRLHDPRRLRRADMEVLARAAAAIEASPLHVCDDGTLTLSGLRAVVRRERLRHGTRLVVIDYLQLLSTEGLPGLGRNSVREQQVAAMSRALKGLARDLEIPVVALCQLNRAAEAREDHRPRMSDLRESGGLEADADVVMLMHREDYYAATEAAKASKRGVAEIIVAKNRNGPTDTVRVAYVPECARFGNLAHAAGECGA